MLTSADVFPQHLIEKCERSVAIKREKAVDTLRSADLVPHSIMTLKRSKQGRRKLPVYSEEARATRNLM